MFDWWTLYYDVTRDMRYEYLNPSAIECNVVVQSLIVSLQSQTERRGSEENNRILVSFNGR